MGERTARPDPSMPVELARLLRHAEQLMSRRLATVLAWRGCTLEQWRVLVLLADGGDHSMSEVAELALVPAPTLTRLVDRMVADGLVDRRIDPVDRRRVLVRITRRGKRLQRELAARLEGDEVLAELAEGELAQLSPLLRAVIERLG